MLRGVKGIDRLLPLHSFTLHRGIQEKGFQDILFDTRRTNDEIERLSSGIG